MSVSHNIVDAVNEDYIRTESEEFFRGDNINIYDQDYESSGYDDYYIQPHNDFCDKEMCRTLCTDDDNRDNIACQCCSPEIKDDDVSVSSLSCSTDSATMEFDLAILRSYKFQNLKVDLNIYANNTTQVTNSTRDGSQTSKVA